MSAGSDNRYDAVIVGAGPAGCMAALNLSSGKSALLVDRLRLPRDVICGGVLSSMSVEQLSTMGLPASLVSVPETLDWCVFDWRLGRAGSWRGGERYVNIDRSAFDRWLLDTVFERDGVDVMPETAFRSFREHSAGKGVTVELLRSGKSVTVEAGCLIGADGALSRVRWQLTGSRLDHWIAVQEVIDADGITPDRFLAFLGEDIGFYGWVIPKGPSLLVGAGFDPSDGGALERFAAFREQLSRKHDIAGVTVRRARARPITRLHSIRQIFPGTSRVLLAGEAAGFISPWSGEGINYALASGRMAGAASGSDSPVEVYARSIRRLWTRLQKDIALRNIMKRPYGRLIAASIAPQASFRRLTKAS